mmetsp:Transcript_21822/g.63498  ORF Transcript_21822/g.63498 Transcript_21822/m.63498 type:complete len:249 (-) Transcript_21822:878-1624(-)
MDCRIYRCLVYVVGDGNGRRLGWRRQERVHVVGDHSAPFLKTGEGKLDHLVDAVVDGPVELLWLVAGVNDHKFVACLASPEEKGIQGVAHILGDVLCGTFPKKGIALVDKKEQAAAAGVRPLENFVDLCHRIPAKRGNVTAGEDRVLHARILCKRFGEERLASAWWAVEQEVAEGGSVALRVAGGLCHGAQTLRHPALKNYTIEHILLCASTPHEPREEPPDRPCHHAQTGVPRGLSNQGRLSEPRLD